MSELSIDYHASILKEVLDEVTTFDDDEAKQEFLLDITEEYRKKLISKPKNDNIMKPCVGAKIVKAKPMDYYAFLEQVKDREVDVKGEETPENAEGFLVEYPDGYQSWNVKHEFERCSRKLTEIEEGLIMEGNDKIGKDDGFEFYVTTKILGLAKRVWGNAQTGETGEDGYSVLYPNGHESKTPAEKADEVYRVITQDEYSLIMDGLAEKSNPDQGESDINTSN